MMKEQKLKLRVLQCKSRAHCETCRTDADWRERVVGAREFECPHGVGFDKDKGVAVESNGYPVIKGANRMKVQTIKRDVVHSDKAPIGFLEEVVANTVGETGDAYIVTKDKFEELRSKYSSINFVVDPIPVEINEPITKTKKTTKKRTGSTPIPRKKGGCSKCSRAKKAVGKALSEAKAKNDARKKK